jgi:hypothetical protein
MTYLLSLSVSRLLELAVIVHENYFIYNVLGKIKFLFHCNLM